MSRIGLIDHATLSSAQRLLGDIKVSNLYNIDGDIAAVEGLIQAFLFCDEIICLDDYKKEFLQQRKNRFDFIQFIGKEDVNYEQSMNFARETVEDVSFRLRGREIDSQLLKEFMDQLNSHIVFNWTQAASTYYLTVNLLADQSGVDIEKYSTIHAMINSQFFGEKHSPTATSFPILDRNGNSLDGRINGEDLAVGPQVLHFAAALNWLAIKSAFYIHVARSIGAELILHPIRHAFVLQILHRRGALEATPYSAISQLLKNGITTTTTKITEASDPIVAGISLPMWSAYLATRTGDPSEFFTECKHLRQEGFFVEAREILSELETINRERYGEFVPKVNKLRASLEKTGQSLLRKYGVKGSQSIPLSPFINLMMQSHSGLSIPEVSIPTPRRLQGTTSNRGFRGIFRSVVDDLITIERLGKLHDIITSRVVKKGDVKYPVKKETTEWLGRNSSWKKWL